LPAGEGGRGRKKIGLSAVEVQKRGEGNQIANLYSWGVAASHPLAGGGGYGKGPRLSGERKEGEKEGSIFFIPIREFRFVGRKGGGPNIKTSIAEKVGGKKKKKQGGGLFANRRRKSHRLCH